MGSGKHSFIDDPAELGALLAVARGEVQADLVLRGGRLVNVFSGEIYPAEVAIYAGRIAGVSPTTGTYRGADVLNLDGEYITPGLIDAHMHIESSMLLPAEFANAVLPHGTTSVVTDPHEIANVHGLEGINFMLQASEGLPLRVFVMLSPCVPATDMETAGARLSADDLSTLLDHQRVLGIAEMMNYPGVAGGSADMVEKLMLGHRAGMRIDGHAPLVRGLTLQAYVAAGVSSDHESVTEEEALEKLRAGCQLLIREGSTARNLDALLPLVNARTSRFCSWATDDKQPEDLRREGHIDHNIRRAVSRGLDPVLALQMGTINTARHYGLNDLGAIAPGYRADLLTISDLSSMHVTRTFAAGKLVAEGGRMLEPCVHRVELPRNTMAVPSLRFDHFRIKSEGKQARVIRLLSEQIVTRSLVMSPLVAEGYVQADTSKDILKIAVIERHGRGGHTGLGLVNGFHLQGGALASSVAHDSHNLVVVGASDEDMAVAANAVVAMGGGLAAACDGQVHAQLALPVAGLMSDRPLEEVRAGMEDLLRAARSLGCTLSNPYMAMAFLALPVIPELKLTDMGLVDVVAFQLCSLFVS
ncbi:MAG: adenine deaminase [Chloroflexota bacterium]|nr:adenine deaminase [Chloroflexota bacterium]